MQDRFAFNIFRCFWKHTVILEYIKIVTYAFTFVYSCIRLQKRVRKCLDNLPSAFQRSCREFFNYLFQTSCLMWKEVALQFLVDIAMRLLSVKVSVLSGHCTEMQ